QKNLGPSGVTVVIIRQDMLERPAGVVPSMLKYSSYAKSNSLYNTPNCFGIYVIDLVLAWLEEEVGGLENMAALNRRKAQLLYQALDARPDFYRPTAERGSRSLMNVTFRLRDESLEAALVAEALEHGLGGLKGHRSVGGLRASLYNAVPLAAVEALAGFLADFAQRKG
ncbi:MAG: aminotransferase class V-fold PLP-dependent enzyme, partial [Thermodesulfobacteriota bacterium]